MPTHLGDASKEGDDTRGRRSRQPSRAGLSSVSSHVLPTPGVEASSMLLHTAVTSAFRRSSRKAVVLRHPHMAEGHSPSSSSKPAREAATNLLQQHQDATVDTHSGNPPRVADPSPQAQGQARGDPDLARGGPDQACILPPADSHQESTIAPSTQRRTAAARQGLPSPSLVAATSTP
jgi:hypothetical protein